MEKWEKQEGEGEKLYQSFLEYLKVRSYEKVAMGLNKSLAYIRKIAGQWKWRERAAEYDKSVVEEAREQMKAQLTASALTQWKNSLELQELAMTAFRQKDFSKASFKSLNEIYNAAVSQQMKLSEQFKLFEEAASPEQEVHIYLPDNGRDEE